MQPSQEELQRTIALLTNEVRLLRIELQQARATGDANRTESRPPSSEDRNTNPSQPLREFSHDGQTDQDPREPQDPRVPSSTNTHRRTESSLHDSRGRPITEGAIVRFRPPGTNGRSRTRALGIVTRLTVHRIYVRLASSSDDVDEVIRDPRCVTIEEDADPNRPEPIPTRHHARREQRRDGQRQPREQ